MNFFSKLGNDLILPKDVLIQSQETKKVKNSINATIGMAMETGNIMFLPTLSNIIKKLSVEEYLPYAPTTGYAELRKLWKEKIINQNNNVNHDYLSLPIATTGITQGIDIVASLFAEKNTAVILPNLYWQNYKLIFSIKRQSTIYTYSQFKEEKFYYDNIDKVLNEIKEEKIIILLNFPNNPTGYTPSEYEFDKLKEIFKKFLKRNPAKKLIFICDDAYFSLFYEKNNNCSSFNKFSELAEFDNCLIVKVDGVTKEFYAWGLRLGFISYYLKNDNIRDLILEKTQGFIRSVNSSGSALSQNAIIKALKNEKISQEIENNYSILNNRYIYLKEQIEKENLKKYLKILPFNSGYFFTILLPKNINANSFRIKLLENYKIGVYAMDDRHIRIAFSCLNIKNIEYLVTSLKDCIKKYY